jgi:hypothetical protein
MKNSLEFEITLPRGVRLKDIRVGSIPLDDKWETIVRENHHNIDKLPLGVARRKYG